MAAAAGQGMRDLRRLTFCWRVSLRSARHLRRACKSRIILGRWGPYERLFLEAVTRNQGCVEGIGFVASTDGGGVSANAGGIDDADDMTMAVQPPGQCVTVATRGFHAGIHLLDPLRLEPGAAAV